MWDIHDVKFDFAETRNRAIILPSSGDAFLENAAAQWEIILNDIVNGKMTVQQAVDDSNSKNTIQQFVVYGNHSVRIK